MRAFRAGVLRFFRALPLDRNQPLNSLALQFHGRTAGYLSTDRGVPCQSTFGPAVVDEPHLGILMKSRRIRVGAVEYLNTAR